MAHALSHPVPDYGTRPAQQPARPLPAVLGLLLALLLLSTPLLAQQKTVSGRITGEAGDGLPGVTVLVKGTTNGTTTDTEGKYSLNIPEGNATLVVPLSVT